MKMKEKIIKKRKKIKKKKKNEKKNNNNNNDNKGENKLTESKKIQNQLNFFGDSITKGISHKRNDKSIYNNQNIIKENKNEDEDKKTVSDFDNDNVNDGDQINLLSKDQFNELKKK